MNANQLIRRPIVAALLGAGAVALPAGALYLYGDAPQAAETAVLPAATAAGPSSAAATQSLPDFRSLVERNGPSVVNISVLPGARVRTGTGRAARRGTAG